MEKTDEQLVSEYNDTGDVGFLETLIERYSVPVYNFIYRYTGFDSHANDLAQDTFVKMWRNIKKFDSSKRFKTWIFQIAKNTALDWLKKKHPKTFSELEIITDSDEEYAFDVADTTPLPDELATKKELEKEVERALMKISPEFRAVISLHLFSELTFQEISDMTGEPLNTIKSRYRRGLSAIKEHLLK